MYFCRSKGRKTLSEASCAQQKPVAKAVRHPTQEIFRLDLVRRQNLELGTGSSSKVAYSYSARYSDDEFEYRHVILPKAVRLFVLPALVWALSEQALTAGEIPARGKAADGRRVERSQHQAVPWMGGMLLKCERLLHELTPLRRPSEPA